MSALYSKIRPSNRQRGESTETEHPGFLSLMCFSWRVGKGRFLTSACCVSVAQSCQTLCDPIDYMPLRTSVHGILHQGSWNGLPFLPPGHLPEPGIKPLSPGLLRLLHCKWIQLPLSLWGQRVVVSPISMEGNSCCATNICTRKTFLSVLSGLFEALVIWPA